MAARSVFPPAPEHETPPPRSCALPKTVRRRDITESASTAPRRQPDDGMAPGDGSRIPGGLRSPGRRVRDRVHRTGRGGDETESQRSNIFRYRKERRLGHTGADLCGIGATATRVV